MTHPELRVCVCVLCEPSKNNITSFFFVLHSPVVIQNDCSHWVGKTAKSLSRVWKRSLLKLRGPVHRGLWIQQKVLLGDPPRTGVNGNHWEAHLKSPAVHDVVDCVRDLKTWCGCNCLKSRVGIARVMRDANTHTLQWLPKPCTCATVTAFTLLSFNLYSLAGGDPTSLCTLWC